ncbi:MAG: hypothetical protein HXY28_01320 [Hydrogenophilaceae bacterium]|jgi:hypothetical protein|nr:hypothetical protein [Hydrogenophilaceae bacterium]
MPHPARFALAGLAVLAACGGERPAPNPYPAQAKATFNEGCPAGDPVCDCTWDNITRAMTYEDYREAMRTSLRDGLLDPRLAQASAACKE